MLKIIMKTGVTESAGNGYSDDPVQGILNDTDSDDVSDFSHLDAPNESLYMVGGLCVAMFLVGIIILLLAITISKLRKREEHSNTVHPATDATTVVLQTSPNGTTLNCNGTINAITGANGTVQNHQGQQNQNGVNQKDGANDPLAYRGMFLWQFPPPPPQSQYLYNNEQNAIVQKSAMERQGSFRGLRKNLGGQWRRLVKKKPPQQNYAIPAELKPQLKQIYVY